MYQPRNQENTVSVLWLLGLPRSINRPRREIWSVAGKLVLVE